MHAAVVMREPCERIRCCAEYAAQVASLDAQLDQLKAADVMARQQMQRCGCSPHPVGAHRERLRRLTHETSRCSVGISCRLQEVEAALSASQHSLDAERERCCSTQAELQSARQAKEEVCASVGCNRLQWLVGAATLCCLCGRWMRRLCC